MEGKMKNFKTKTCMVSVLALFAAGAFSATWAQKDSKEKVKINWVSGPAKADMNKIAGIRVPKGFHFADGNDTRTIMKLTGNLESGKEVGYLSPESNQWFIVFEFNESGYVKDDEKGSLDADAMLESLKEGNKKGNEWRKEQGMREIELVGWKQKPSYDQKTNNLEWATILKSSEGTSINYNIRYLGRKGVMEVVIVAGEKDLASAVKASKKALEGYSFTSGNKYSEFMEGDKIAEYGLTALVTGGALAAAAKMGFLKKFWKIIVGGIAATGAFLKKIFGKKDESEIGQIEDNSTNQS